MKKSNSLKTHKLCFAIGIALLILIVILRFFDPPFIRILNLKTLDLFFQHRGVQSTGKQVVIVAVDEKSIADKGRWPWSRSIMAKLVDKLTQYGTRVIGFDIVFSEPEQQDSYKTIIALRNFVKKSDQLTPSARVSLEKYLEKFLYAKQADTIFAQSLKNGCASVLGQFFFVSPDEIKHIAKTDQYQDNLKYFRKQRIIYLFEGDSAPPDDIIFTPVGVNLNLISIMQAAGYSGFFNTIPDIDGAIRRMPLICRFNDEYYPSLALKLVSVYLNQPIKLYLNEYGVELIKVGKVIPPIDIGGTMLINFAGPSMTIPHYSAVDILDDKIAPALLKDKIVIIGITATGLYDIRLTPYSAVYPGVEIHANAVDNMLNSRYLYYPWWIRLSLYVLIVIFGILLSLILPRMKALTSGIFTLFLTISFIVLSYMLFKIFNIWYPPIYGIITIGATYIAITLTKFIVEEKERRFIKGAFSQYLSPQLVNQLVNNPDLLKLGGEEKELTVLFTDIIGFTGISEKLGPVELVELLNIYTTEMSDIIMRFRGTIDKYSGDAIMAFFGAPIYFPDHAKLACRAAIAMHTRLCQLREKWEQAGRPFFATRIGINTGKMVVGNMGSKQKFNYTVLGDAVNLASRLEGANKFYKTSIIIGEDTCKQVSGTCITRELDLVRVVGKKQPVHIFELICLADNLSAGLREFLEYYNEGIKHITKHAWRDAVRYFTNALKIRPDDIPAQIHKQRCEQLIKMPPKTGWDGAYDLKNK